MTTAKAKDAPAAVRYDEDVLLWSQQQARFLREGRFAELDIEHLADEIEDVAAYLGIPLDVARRLGATADGPRYKAIGNSMAVPVMRWIGRRVDAVEQILRRAA